MIIFKKYRIVMETKVMISWLTFLMRWDGIIFITSCDLECVEFDELKEHKAQSSGKTVQSVYDQAEILTMGMVCVGPCYSSRKPSPLPSRKWHWQVPSLQKGHT